MQAAAASRRQMNSGVDGAACSRIKRPEEKRNARKKVYHYWKSEE